MVLPVKIANKRLPKGNALLYVSFTTISLVLMLMIFTMRIGNTNNIFEFDTGSEITTDGVKASFFERFLSADNIMGAMYIMITISFILSTIVVTDVWRTERHQLVYALSLCGIADKFRYFEIVKRYVCIVVAGFATAAVISVILAMIDDVIDVTAGDMACSFVITMITCLAIFAFDNILHIVKSKLYN